MSRPAERLEIAGLFSEADVRTERKNNMPKEQVDWLL